MERILPAFLVTVTFSNRMSGWAIPQVAIKRNKSGKVFFMVDIFKNGFSCKKRLLPVFCFTMVTAF